MFGTHPTTFSDSSYIQSSFFMCSYTLSFRSLKSWSSLLLWVSFPRFVVYFEFHTWSVKVFYLCSCPCKIQKTNPEIWRNRIPHLEYIPLRVGWIVCVCMSVINWAKVRNKQIWSSARFISTDQTSMEVLGSPNIAQRYGDLVGMCEFCLIIELIWTKYSIYDARCYSLFTCIHLVIIVYHLLCFRIFRYDNLPFRDCCKKRRCQKYKFNRFCLSWCSCSLVFYSKFTWSMRISSLF